MKSTKTFSAVASLRQSDVWAYAALLVKRVELPQHPIGILTPPAFFEEFLCTLELLGGIWLLEARIRKDASRGVLATILATRKLSAAASRTQLFRLGLYDPLEDAGPVHLVEPAFENMREIDFCCARFCAGRPDDSAAASGHGRRRGVLRFLAMGLGVKRRGDGLGTGPFARGWDMLFTSSGMEDSLRSPDAKTAPLLPGPTSWQSPFFGRKY